MRKSKSILDLFDRQRTVHLIAFINNTLGDCLDLLFIYLRALNSCRICLADRIFNLFGIEYDFFTASLNYIHTYSLLCSSSDFRGSWTSNYSYLQYDYTCPNPKRKHSARENS